jgi:hypothetical protein
VISCLNGARPKQGRDILFNGQSVETRTPSRISDAAFAMMSGVKRFSIPHSSLSPKRPQAFPGGPSFLRGRASKGGLDDIVSLR